jgi:hypothetical protein
MGANLKTEQLASKALQDSEQMSLKDKATARREVDNLKRRRDFMYIFSMYTVYDLRLLEVICAVNSPRNQNCADLNGHMRHREAASGRVWNGISNMFFRATPLVSVLHFQGEFGPQNTR